MWISLAQGGVITSWDGIMYVAQDKITVAWDPSQGADYYEVQVLWIDPTSGPVIYNIGQTTNTQIEISKPRTGHFYVRVRACNEAGCSAWSESIDPEKTKNGKTFRVYFRVSAPSGNITIK